MKRTVEMVLAICGMVLDFGIAILGVIILFTFHIGIDLIEILFHPFLNEISYLVKTAALFVWVPIIASIISFVLGLIGTVNVAGNKRPKLAGSLFIAAAILTSWQFFIFGSFQAALYLIAGIMCFLRNENKPGINEKVL